MRSSAKQASAKPVVNFSSRVMPAAPRERSISHPEPACPTQDYFQPSSYSNKDVKSLLLFPPLPARPSKPMGEVRGECQWAAAWGAWSTPTHSLTPPPPALPDPGKTPLPAPPGPISSYGLVFLPSLQALGVGLCLGDWVPLGFTPPEDKLGLTRGPRTRVSIEAEPK